MIVLAAALLGIVIGITTARRRGGRGLDQAQYAAGYGIAFSLLGVIATLAIDRLWL